MFQSQDLLEFKKEDMYILMAHIHKDLGDNYACAHLIDSNQTLSLIG